MRNNYPRRRRFLNPGRPGFRWSPVFFGMTAGSLNGAKTFMKSQRWMAAFLLVLVAGGQRISGEPVPEGFLQRLGPASGWHPMAAACCARGTLLFPALWRPGRPLPQVTSQRLLAALPVLL